MRRVLWLPTLYGLVAPVVILDCLTGFSSPVMAMIHNTADIIPLNPGDGPESPPPGMSSAGVLLWIFAATAIAGLIGLVVMRIILWATLTKTGWLGRNLGEGIIIGILRTTGTRGKNWERDLIVRMIFKDISGRKLISMAAIMKNCSHGEPFTVGRAANDNRPGRALRKRLPHAA